MIQKLLIPFLLILAQSAWAQDNFIIKNKFEFQVNYALQRTFLSVNNPIDNILPKAKRYRSAIGVGMRYHAIERLFVDLTLIPKKEWLC